jgi:DNA replication protein DnaC
MVMVLGLGPEATVAIGDSGTGKSHVLIGLTTAAAEKGSASNTPSPPGP